jgi:hypothetical protein
MLLKAGFLVVDAAEFAVIFSAMLVSVVVENMSKKLVGKACFDMVFMENTIFCCRKDRINSSF